MPWYVSPFSSMLTNKELPSPSPAKFGLVFSLHFNIVVSVLMPVVGGQCAEVSGVGGVA